jgi:hypothetical protein
MLKSQSKSPTSARFRSTAADNAFFLGEQNPVDWGA